MKFPLNTDLWHAARRCCRGAARVRSATCGNFQVFGRLDAGVTLAQARVGARSTSRPSSRTTIPTPTRTSRRRSMTFNERSTAAQIQTDLPGADGRGRLRAADRLRQRRQPAARALGAARARDCGPRLARRHRWRIVRQLLVESVLLSIVSGAARPRRSRSSASGCSTRRDADVGKPYWMKFTMDGDRLRVLRRGLPRHRRRLRPRAGAARLEDRRQRGDEGRAAAAAAAAMRARRWTGALIVAEARADARAARRRRLHDAQLPHALPHGHRLRHVAPADDAADLPLTKYPTREPRHGVSTSGSSSGLHGVRAIQSAATDARNAPLQRRLRCGSCRSTAGRSPTGEQAPEVTAGHRSAAGYFDTLGVPVVARPRRSTTATARRRTTPRSSTSGSSRCISRGEDPLGRRIKLVDAGPPAPNQPLPVDAPIVGIVPNVRQRDSDETGSGSGRLPAVSRRSAAVRGADGPDRGRARQRSRRWCARRCAVDRAGPAALRHPDDGCSSWRSMRWPFRVFGSMFAIFAVIALVLSAVGSLRGDGVLGVAADAGDRRADGARRASRRRCCG